MPPRLSTAWRGSTRRSSARCSAPEKSSRRGGSAPPGFGKSRSGTAFRRARSMRARVLAAALLGLAARTAAAQFLSDLEPDRPVSVEDARPISYRALSGSADWTYTLRKGSLNDYGPGFSLLYGAARGLETGASIRYVTRPERNATRGIASGDLTLHALYQIVDESAALPALAFRAGVEFPTGLDSK